MTHPDAAEDLERGVVVHRALPNDTTVPVAGVLAAADIGDQKQVWMAFPNATQRPLHDPVIGEVLAADLIFRGGQAEKNHRLDVTASDSVDFAVQLLVGRELEHSGHGADLALHPAAMSHEQGLDEIGGRELVLPDEAAHGWSKPAAAGPVERGKGHKGRLESGKPPRNQRGMPHW